jgi:VanZ family protein
MVNCHRGEDRTHVSYSCQTSEQRTPTLGMQKKALGVFCGAVLVGILTAGLWPFHAPKNEVSWLSNGNGLHFGNHGVILSPHVLSLAGLKDGISCSLEIWLQPDHGDTGGAILVFYTLQNSVVTFSMHQSIDDLLLRGVTAYRQRRAKSTLYIDHAFSKNKQILVTISSNGESAAVYVNGALVRTSPRFGLSSKDLIGQLIVGNHPLTDDGWQGQIKGLAIYNRELPAAEVSQHFDAWTGNRQAEIKKEGPAALYLCNEGSGNVVHNQMNLGNDLQIPERYFVLHAAFLELPWDEFQPSWSYCKDVLINIGGFIPLGFFFCAYFSSARRWERPMLTTIVLGGMVSFSIEVLQAFLPTRDSGTTDLFTNTLGTAIGAMLYGREWVQALFVKIGLEGWVAKRSYGSNLVSESDPNTFGGGEGSVNSRGTPERTSDPQ